MSYKVNFDLALLARFPDYFYPQSQEEAEEILAEELNRLLLKEHEKVCLHIHGIVRVWQARDPKKLWSNLDKKA